MDKIEQIKAEIERLKNKNGPYMASCVTLIVIKACSKDEAYDEVLSFIDSLPAEEKPSEDLEKYASRAGFDYVDDIESKYPGHRWNDHDVEFAHRDGIIAGVQWQKEQMEERWLKDRDGCFWDGVEEGKKVMREQMLKEAVEGTYDNGDWGVPCIDLPTPLDLERFDKVKLIIVKED